MQILFYKNIFLSLAILLTACQAPLNQSNNQSQNDSQNNPYTQFKQERASLEPLIETSSIVTRSNTKIARQNQSKVNLPQVQPLDISGNLEIAGSSGMSPLNELIYQRFINLGYSGIINFSTVGTNESIKLFCQGEKFDLLTLSRPLKEKEKAACQASGIEPIYLPMGKGAVAIVVSRQNNFLDKVTISMLEDIFTQEKWSDVNPSFPDEPIRRLPLGPGATFDIVVDKVLPGNSDSFLNAPNTTLHWYEQPVIQELSRNIYGVSFLSYPVFEKSSNVLKSVVVDGSSPDSLKFANTSYPFERTLYILVDRNQLKNQETLNAFINFYLTNVNEQVRESGLFPITSQELDESKRKFLQAIE